LNQIRFMDYFHKSKGKYLYNDTLISKELERVRCSINKASIQAAFFLLSRIMSNMVESLHVDLKSIENIKSLVKDRKTRVVFMPLYKSYGDPLIMHYVNYFTD
jgi:hypothetical protein